MMHLRLAAAVILVLQAEATSRPNERPDDCERHALGSITQARLVERFGAPCFVQLPWQEYKDGRSQDLQLVYAAVCGVKCPPDGLFGGAGLCHNYAPKEALLGPLGPAHQATFVVREGVVAFAKWEYTREQVPQARAALKADGRYEINNVGEVAWEARRNSSKCSVTIMEEPQPVIWTMAYPSDEDQRDAEQPDGADKPPL